MQAMDKNIKEQIASLVMKVLNRRFKDFPEGVSSNRNAPFHEAFLNAFSAKLGKSFDDIPYFMSLASWMHGLNTTLGQTFFEKTAHILSNGEKREYTSGKSGYLQIPAAQKQKINEIVTALSNGTRKPNLKDETDEIMHCATDSPENVQDFSADVFINDGTTITVIELKTVKPNSSNMISEKRKIAEGRIALHHKFPDMKIEFLLGFPFDPTSKSDIDYDKARFLSSIIGGEKFFGIDEILLSGELWDKLSGEKNTMQQLLNIINDISTPDFQKNCQFLNNPKNRPDPKYIQLLQKWHLHTEIEILQNESTIKNKIVGNKSLARLFNNEIIKPDGYNIKRAKLLELL